MRSLLLPLLLMTLAGPASAAIKGETVEYRVGDVVMKGYLAYDDAVKGKRPGVLVVHEWWGLNDYIRGRARQLAELGYTALALDMYGDGRHVTHPDEAGKFATEVRTKLPVAKARFQAAYDVLKAHRTVDARRIAAIGYCFGGAVVLDMARQGADLDGVVVFHGSLAASEPAKRGRVKAKVLVLNGADDPFIPPEEVDRFKREMEAAAVDYRYVAYPGVKHAYTNPDATANGQRFNMPLVYNAEADRASWEEMRKFLAGVFAK